MSLLQAVRRNGSTVLAITFLLSIVIKTPAADLPAKAAIFLRAYPESLAGYRDNKLILRDGRELVFDDGRSKTYEQLLSDADPKDELAQSYPVGPDSYGAPAVNFDPGRFRCSMLFMAMYGANAKEVESHLTSIPWLPRSTHERVRITTVNGIDKKLTAISEEFDQLPPDKKKYVTNIAGTFNWRQIAGSKQLSAHSFGIAIDINSGFSDYWRWGSGLGQEGSIPYRNRIPHEIVEIFERHGFIWGGKWYHYDTMHFEYRPELLPQ
jgi:peptidoglycan L-alanyl-D-glutamate endopeptidase CwlK